MRRIVASFFILALVLTAGCQTPLSLNDSEVDEVAPPPTFFSRKEKAGTGIDPLAKDIERRLGYR